MLCTIDRLQETTFQHKDSEFEKETQDLNNMTLAWVVDVYILQILCSFNVKTFAVYYRYFQQEQFAAL